MTKKYLAFLISIIMILSCFPVSVGATEYLPTPTANIVEYEDHKNTSSSLNDADIISINYSNINEIIECAKTWIDAGKTLYIVAPEISAEEVATILNIPKTGTNIYNGALLYAYAIFKANDCYVFENQYAALANSISTYSDNTQEFTSAITVDEYTNACEEDYLTLDQLINWNAVISARADVEQSTNTRSSNSSAPSATFSGTVNVFNNSGNSVGYIRGTAYAYSVGNGYVNNEEGFMYIVSYDVKVYPSENHKVKSYSAKMQYNIDGHNVLRTTTLQSDISTTQSLGFQGTLSKSLSLDNIGIESNRGIDYNISWTHTPESQKFTESSSGPNIITWTAEPKSPTKNKAYGMAPGAEVFVVPGGNGQRGLYLQVKAELKGGFLNLTKDIDFFEIGGFF